MKTSRIILLILVTLFLCQSLTMAHPWRWVKLDVTERGTVYLDPQTIVKQNNELSAWVKIELSDSGKNWMRSDLNQIIPPLPQEKIDDVTYVYSHYRFTFVKKQCNYYIDLDNCQDSKEVMIYQRKNPLQFFQIQPESIDEAILKEAQAILQAKEDAEQPVQKNTIPNDK